MVMETDSDASIWQGGTWAWIEREDPGTIGSWLESNTRPVAVEVIEYETFPPLALDTPVPSTTRVTSRSGKLIFPKVHVVVILPAVVIAVDVETRCA